MSEPSGDSPKPPSAKPAAGSPPQNPVTRAPRANPPTVYNTKEAPAAPPEGGPPGFAEFMAWMANISGGTPTTQAPAGRNLIPKEQKKFVRRTAEELQTAPPEGAVADEPLREGTFPAEPEAEKMSHARPSRDVPPERFEVERKRRPKDEPRSSLALLLIQLGVFALIVGSFFLGRATVARVPAPARNAAPSEPSTSRGDSMAGVLPPALQAKVDEALRAESNLELARAQTLLEEVRDAGGQVHGLTLQIAQMAYFRGNFPRVLSLLNESISRGEEVAACYNLRGTLANRTGGVTKGLDSFELAAKLDPFNARYAFFAGEAMRRTGKPLAAAGYLRQAVYRLREPLLESFYRLKVRLALLDLGQEKEFTGEMATQLALNPPSVDWLFTAAAVELHQGNAAAAAGYLDKAQTLTPQADMNLRLRDYYFYGFHDDKVLSRFFASINSETSRAAAAAPDKRPATNAPDPFTSQIDP